MRKKESVSIRPWLLVLAYCCLIAEGAVCAAQAPQPEAADWPTVFLLRFDETPLKVSGAQGAQVLPGEAPLVEGRFGRALDAAAGGVEVRLPAGTAPLDEATLECWLRLRDRGEERVQRVAGVAGMIGFYISGTREKPEIVYYTSTSAASWKMLKSPITPGEWTHVAGTFDGQRMRLYINGAQAGEVEHPGRLSEKEPVFHIGREIKGDRYRFIGEIDEVRLSKVARTEFLTGRALERPRATSRLVPVRVEDATFVRAMDVCPAAQTPFLDGKLDDDAWKSGAAIPFVLSKEGGQPKTATLVRAVYDSRALYLGFECFEDGLETQIAGTAKRDDRSILKADCVQTFLQPGGPGTPYFQIVANAAGGVLGLRWPRKGQLEAWDGKGIQCKGQSLDGLDMVELAIPFEDMGAKAPKAGAEWRANFCRTELPSKELTAWSPTGGGFQAPERFGVLRFVSVPASGAAGATQSPHRVIGVFLEDDGKPATGAPVGWATGVTRTDANGEFQIASVMGDEVLLKVASPLYEPYAGKAALRQSTEVLEPVRLKRIDPYRPSFAGPIGQGPLAWLESSLVEPPDMARAPSRADLAASLPLLAAPGETESRAVAFFANENVERSGGSHRWIARPFRRCSRRQHRGSLDAAPPQTDATQEAARGRLLVVAVPLA